MPRGKKQNKSVLSWSKKPAKWTCQDGFSGTCLTQTDNACWINIGYNSPTSQQEWQENLTGFKGMRK